MYDTNNERQRAAARIAAALAAGECPACAALGIRTPATTIPANPDVRGHLHCAGCAAELDARQPSMKRRN